MHRYERSVVIAAPVETVFRFHDDTRNLSRITPPGVKVKVLGTSGPEGKGKQIRLRMTQFGFLSNELLIEFVRYDPPRFLVDEQKEGPFRFWRQTRIFEPVELGTKLTDIVEYQAPFGAFGRLAVALLIGPRVAAMFEYRQRRTKEILESGDWAISGA
ncbi:MAG: SRPBCC family protein [Bacteroidota bacterium]